ncbi:MAG: nickel-dependent lactate racemase [Desulfobacterales bacterium]|nr:nickel-dependent lactate racemase [Desulfobacterales bacterium]
MKISLEKGHSSVQLSVPDVKIMGRLLGKDIPALGIESARKIISDGIRASAPDDPARKKVAIIIPDNTRLWARGDLFVPVIVDTLIDLGVPSDAVTIIIALGTHADLDETVFPRLAGEQCTGRIRILNSANRNADRLVHLGRTRFGTDVRITREACEADHIIIFGGVLHHLIAGFGGGRKYILPGIAGYDAIQQNHSLAFLTDGRPHPMVAQGRLAGNPVHEDMCEAADLFFKGKTSIYAAVAANGEGEIFYAGTGPVEETFQTACDCLDHACTAPIEKKGDFALISAGGHRTDTQLYQATKALFNAVNAVKEGGRLLFVAQAEEGVGNPEFESVLKQYANRTETIGSRLLKRFSMPAYVAFRVLDLLNRFDITLVSDLSKQETTALGFGYVENPDDYVERLEGRGYIIPFAENILPVLK